MAVTTSTPDPLNELRSLLGTKLLGNVMRISADLASAPDAFEHVVNRLAESIAEKSHHSGLKPVENSGKVIFQQTDPITNSASVAAKIYAVWSERPIDLIVFCVQAMEDARQTAEQAKGYESEYRNRYIDLLERLAGAKNMREVRELVRRGDEF